jgi:DNA-binding MarR family transcriptional regulator
VKLTRDLEKRVFAAARDNGISAVLFRNAVARKLGVNTTDSECLSLLAIKGVATPKELSSYTGLASGSMTAMLDRLEKAQFIRRRPNPKDRRGVLIEISEKWVEAAEPLVAGVQRAHIELIASYSDEELETIADFLTRFTHNVKEHAKVVSKDLASISTSDRSMREQG